jgi:hypothetical protein
VRLGEGLIKSTYEAIRNSPLWKSSLLTLPGMSTEASSIMPLPLPLWRQETVSPQQVTISLDLPFRSTARACPG